MNENIKWTAAAVAVVGLSIGAIVYFSARQDKVPPPEIKKPVAAVPEPLPAVPEEPAVKHPLPPADKQKPLPPLNESDVPMQGALADLIGKDSVDRFFKREELVRHIVVTIDNLPEPKVAERLRPMKPVFGKFEVGGTPDMPVLNPANYERYQPLVQLIRSTDTQRLVETYSRYYPLFQDAYEDLGHPPEYFNDRVVEVIDHLLTTPDVRDPIALAQPNVLYEFADPKLESLTAGQKALIRMGSDNAKVVKEKLSELRAALIAQPRN
jgi:Protein of unknown function (DUF3014)